MHLKPAEKTYPYSNKIGYSKINWHLQANKYIWGLSASVMTSLSQKVLKFIKELKEYRHQTLTL
jgi:hypothetical protein